MALKQLFHLGMFLHFCLAGEPSYPPERHELDHRQCSPWAPAPPRAGPPAPAVSPSDIEPVTSWWANRWHHPHQNATIRTTSTGTIHPEQQAYLNWKTRPCYPQGIV